ncbi:MAG: hypothetical protein E4H10_07280 [Bacteroidia bacterium]|nr:MAG: hypothetical protein E4H10_07280 [Bacteroidia bacterium]
MQEYNTIDRQFHWLSQLIAKANRAYVPEQEDESHTNLYFDPLEIRIQGRWIDAPKGKIILALNLHSLSFQWLDAKQKILHEVPVLNKTAEQLEKSVSEYPGSLNMSTEAFLRPLLHEITDYKIEKLNRTDISDEGLRRWVYFRVLANWACQDMLGYMQLQSEIRIWPHHFDTGIYIQVKASLGLGFGLAMEDTMVGQAYFYMSGYHGESPISYQNLKPLNAGKWVSGEHWNGAVLPLNEVSGSSSEEALKIIHIFIKETTSWFLNN